MGHIRIASYGGLLTDSPAYLVAITIRGLQPVVTKVVGSAGESHVLLGRAGLGPHGQDTALGVVTDGDHHPAPFPSRPSNNTVPRRTIVAPSSTATSKSLLMPIDRCPSGCGGPTSARSRASNSRRVA